MKDLLLLIRIQARIATFLADLTLDRLVALAEGRAALVVADVAENGRTPAAPVVPLQEEPPNIAPPASRRTPVARRPTADRLSADTSFDAEAVAARLRGCETLDQGTALLSELHLKLVDVKALAKYLKVPQTGRKDDIVKKILTIVFGSRSKHAALQQG
ncbi:hypothetical protein KOI35_33260 [Actinoplanes bogorensis]|uniref:SAP domain-containing protein n=1 Tax=Paractinoplanes bogorensis TaxID=1610840 RepID=A0ABS5YYD3_9ACTN|nr:hypothetical protein [Actinoplanes bogorensis]MBU2668393.1 hypothetical protein [Actinoplanes bogorensis]